ncbi:glucose-methanol-choline oxidoreductase, partial [Mycena metata]
DYTSIPQPGLNSCSIDIQRGQSLCRCTSRNGMVYTRGSVDDYNHFAAVTGDSGWTWDCLLSYFFKLHTMSIDPQCSHTIYAPRTKMDSTRGPSQNAQPIRPNCTQYHRNQFQLPEDWPFSLNMNSGKPLVIGWLQSTIQSGVRSSYATSYLGPEFIDHLNLHVLLHMQVSKLVNPAHLDRKVHFEGMQFMQGKESHLYLNTVTYKKIGGALFTANTTKDIVLSDGTVGTPTILMYSGISDEATWANLGIATLLDLLSVGYNTTDQPLFGATGQ